MISALRRRFSGVTRTDLILFLTIAGAALVLTYLAMDWHPEQYIWSAKDVWFDGDIARVIRIETEGIHGYDRTFMHPMTALLSVPVRLLLHAMSDGRAVRIFHSLIGSFYFSGFFLVLRRFRVASWDAALFTAVLGATASSFFWVPVAENFVIGGFTMFFPLALAAGETAAPVWANALAMVLSAGVTITNGMAGFFAALTTLPFRKFLRSLGLATVMMAVIMLVTREISGEIPRFLKNPGNEAAWMFAPECGGPWAILRHFFFGSVVAPEIGFFINWEEPLLPLMSFQVGGLFSGTAWSWIATPAWLALLLIGFQRLRSGNEPRSLRLTLLAVVLYQLLLHLVYGRETFLYAPHFVPVLVAVTALGTRGRHRTIALAAAALFIVSAGLNNRAQFSWAKAYTNRNTTINELQKRGWAKDFTPPTEDPAREYRFLKEARSPWSREQAR